MQKRPYLDGGQRQICNPWNHQHCKHAGGCESANRPYFCGYSPSIQDILSPVSCQCSQVGGGPSTCGLEVQQECNNIKFQLEQLVREFEQLKLRYWHQKEAADIWERRYNDLLDKSAASDKENEELWLNLLGVLIQNIVFPESGAGEKKEEGSFALSVPSPHDQEVGPDFPETLSNCWPHRDIEWTESSSTSRSTYLPLSVAGPLSATWNPVVLSTSSEFFAIQNPELAVPKSNPMPCLSPFSPCAHRGNWTRIRSKRGQVFYECRLCLHKWRVPANRRNGFLASS